MAVSVLFSSAADDVRCISCSVHFRLVVMSSCSDDYYSVTTANHVIFIDVIQLSSSASVIHYFST